MVVIKAIDYRGTKKFENKRESLLSPKTPNHSGPNLFDPKLVL